MIESPVKEKSVKHMTFSEKLKKEYPTTISENLIKEKTEKQQPSRDNEELKR